MFRNIHCSGLDGWTQFEHAYQRAHDEKAPRGPCALMHVCASELDAHLAFALYGMTVLSHDHLVVIRMNALGPSSESLVGLMGCQPVT